MSRPGRGIVAAALRAIVRAYQLIVSPWFAPSCKYYPSCSAYAMTALERHGAWRGTVLGAWRLLRCNPWSDGGVDHVPEHGEPMPWSADRRRARTLDVVDGGARPPVAPKDS